MAAKLFTPQLLRRGLEIFLLISLAGFVFTFYLRQEPAGRARQGAAPALGMAPGGAAARLDGLDRRWAAPLGGRPRGASQPAAQRDDPGRRHECLGGLPHPAPVGRGADDDLHHAALRHSGAGGADVHADDVHRHHPLLRHRRAPRHLPRARASRWARRTPCSGSRSTTSSSARLGVFVVLGVVLLAVIIFPKP